MEMSEFDRWDEGMYKTENLKYSYNRSRKTVVKISSLFYV
jgi:hypothetical protein